MIIINQNKFSCTLPADRQSETGSVDDGHALGMAMLASDAVHGIFLRNGATDIAGCLA